MVCKVMTSFWFKNGINRNSFDICTIKIIFEFLYSWLVNPIDVITLLMRGRPQAEQAKVIEICDEEGP